MRGGEHTMNVWGKPIDVSVHQSSKSVWVAVGYYMDQRIEVKARSVSSALAGWRKAAEYKGNL